jgi:dTDP-4-dehydrorhamnose 3,5-epimerase
MIDGVYIKKLVVHTDDRGQLFEIWRADDCGFCGFGQVYVTTAHPGIIKGWHYHQKQTDCFTVIKGRALFALYDARDNSPTRGELLTFHIGEDERIAIVIPPGVYHGFKNIGAEEVWCLNCPNHEYNAAAPDEHRVDPFDSAIGFDWATES